MSGQPLDEKVLEGVTLRETTETVSLVSFPDLGDNIEVLAFIGEGGMGSVYKVHDKRLDKTFAVKLLKQELAMDSSKQSRFQKEVNAAVDLDHPNLVTVYHHAVAPDGTPYMVMDFVDGGSIAEILADQPFIEPSRAQTLFIQICDGVAHAHVHGVVHLDLKPSNILVAKNDNIEIAKVSDFGIAQVMTDESQQISQTEEIIGSLPYMSPEHCRGESLDYRSDVYSLGCLMYEVLTGKPPFSAENPVKTIMKHIQEKPKRLKSRLTRLDIPEGLERVVLHCLEKNPNHRYQNTEELIKDLELVRDGLQPLIALQQEQALSTVSNESSKKHVKTAVIAGLCLLSLYFIHLSQYDTLMQFGLFCASLTSLLLLAALTVVLILTRRKHKEVDLRLKDKTQILPGDRWLAISMMAGGFSVAFIMLMCLLNLLTFNHVEPFESFSNIAPELTWQIGQTILIIINVTMAASLAIWLGRRNNPAVEQKTEGW
jgi:serine/threonine protein kinase